MCFEYFLSLAKDVLLESTVLEGGTRGQSLIMKCTAPVVRYIICCLKPGNDTDISERYWDLCRLVVAELTNGI